MVNVSNIVDPSFESHCPTNKLMQMFEIILDSYFNNVASGSIALGERDRVPKKFALNMLTKVFARATNIIIINST